MTYDERDLYTGLATLSWLAYDQPGWDHDYHQIFLCEHDYSGKTAEPLPTRWNHHHANEFPESNRRLVLYHRTTDINPVAPVAKKPSNYTRAFSFLACCPVRVPYSVAAAIQHTSIKVSGIAPYKHS